MTHHSAELAQRWAELSLAEQLGNVGSEVSRMLKWRDKNRAIAESAFERMLELLDLTRAAGHSSARLRELGRARELLVAAWLGDQPADSAEWQSLNKYFLQYAVAARRSRAA